MLKKITSIKDLEAIKPGDSMFSHADASVGTEYHVAMKAGEDLVVTYQNGLSGIKLLTREDLLSNDWWVKG